MYVYCIARKFGERKFDKFGKLSVIRQTKTIQMINKLLADLLICQIFFHQLLKKSQFAKLSPTKLFYYTVHTCDRACKNQPCKYKKSPILCFYSIIIPVYTNMTKPLPLLQNLMGSLLQFTET